MPVLPMFPLGGVLMPHMPLPLRVFEPRYLAMLADILGDDPARFGVVLIERGPEVGGGDVRVEIGTVAEVAQLDSAGESVLLVAQGAGRIRVTGWLADDPYPKAEVEELDELPWDEALQPLLERTEAEVRRVLRLADEAGEELRWPADVGVDADPVAAAWQLAAIAPLGPLDQLDLLRSETIARLLSRTVELVTEAEALYT